MFDEGRGRGVEAMEWTRRGSEVGIEEGVSMGGNCVGTYRLPVFGLTM